MRKNLLYTLLLTGLAAGAVAASPKPIKAQDDDYSGCHCTGGCENLKYYNYCGNGLCSFYCT